MGPISAIARCYVRIVTFSGRARRAEYWWFTLYLFLVGIAVQTGLIAHVAGDPELLVALNDPAFAQSWMKQNEDALYMAGYAFAGYLVLGWLPHLSVTVRRLHDTNRSGWFIFMPFLASLVSIGLAIVVALFSGGNPAGSLPLILLVSAIPLAANIWFLVVLCLPGSHGTNRFGPDPIPNRKRKPPAHPAFTPQLEPEERAEIEALRRAEIKDYYRKNVLPGVQKA